MEDKDQALTDKKPIYKRWWFWLVATPLIVALIILGFTALGSYGNLKDTDYNHPPVFITHDFINLAKIDTISKYRSGVGHDYSGNGETCRSMRHYFSSSNSSYNAQANSDNVKEHQDKVDSAHATEIYAPADGRIVSISGEGSEYGKQIEIEPKSGQGWHIRLDHVYPDDGIRIASQIKAGQVIGHVDDRQVVDMTILYHYRGSVRLASYFQVMTDEVFANYQARGVKSRSDLIIPKELVDAHPWKCDNNRPITPDFIKNSLNPNQTDAFTYAHLSGWMAPPEDSAKAKDKDIIDFKTCAARYPVVQTYPPRCITSTGSVFEDK